MSTNICCAACRRAETTTTEYLNWCVECSELICKHCASFHRRFKTTCEHQMVAVTKEKAIEILSSVVERNCKDHPKQVISYLCRDHDILCCNTCVITKHGTCKVKTGTEEIGKAMKDGKAVKEPTQWIRRLERTCTFLEFGLSHARKELEHGKHAISNDIKDMRDKVNASIDELEQTILDDYHSKAQTIESQIALDTETLFKARKEAIQLESTLRVNLEMASNTQYLLANRRTEGKRKELNEQVNGIVSRGRILKCDWSMDPLICDIRTIVKNQKLQKDFIKTHEMPLPTAFNSSTFVIEKEKKISWFVNVEILEDSRVLVLDYSQTILKLLDSNLKQTCQMFVKDAKHFAAVSKNLIVVSLNDCKLLKLFKLSGTKIVINGEISVDLNCISVSKYQSSAVLLCSNEETDQPYSLYPGEVIFKLLNEDKSLEEFSFQKMDKISPWRGFVFDSRSNTFVAISTDGSSLIWLAKSGQFIKEKRIDSIGRGGLSGLAVDTHGRVYAAATRKIFEITGTGNISGTFDASINVYSIAVSTKGDKLIAVGHNHAIEMFTLIRLD